MVIVKIYRVARGNLIDISFMRRNFRHKYHSIYHRNLCHKMLIRHHYLQERWRCGCDEDAVDDEAGSHSFSWIGTSVLTSNWQRLYAVPLCQRCCSSELVQVLSLWVTPGRNLHLDALQLSTPDKTSEMNFCKHQSKCVTYIFLKTWHCTITFVIF